MSHDRGLLYHLGYGFESLRLSAREYMPISEKRTRRIYVYEVKGFAGYPSEP